jgi:hypothetical protein
MFARTLSRSLIVAAILTLFGAVPVLGQSTASPPPAVEAALSCTFTSQYPAVNLRSGAGQEFYRRAQWRNPGWRPGRRINGFVW